VQLDHKGSILALTTAVIGTGRWAGVDNAWEQRKLEARKMLENAAESHLSSAPSNDGGRSFSTGERPVFHRAGKVMIFEEKGSFFAFSV